VAVACADAGLASLAWATLEPERRALGLVLLASIPAVALHHSKRCALLAAVAYALALVSKAVAACVLALPIVAAARQVERFDQAWAVVHARELDTMAVACALVLALALGAFYDAYDLCVACGDASDECRSKGARKSGHVPLEPSP
jgi:hypothetical protein